MRDQRDRRDNRNMRDNRRDYNRPNDRDRGSFRAGEPERDLNRAAPPRDVRDNRERRDIVRPATEVVSRERDPKPLEERMPKFQEPSGPNLSMKNTFEGLSADEIDD